MANRFNYRCPKCGSPDEIDICAFISVHLTSDGAELAQDLTEITPQSWSSEIGAGCGACGFEGLARDFQPQGATVIELFPRQVSRR